MEDQSTPEPGAQPLTAEAASGRRAELIADPQWRANAATGKGPAWEELQLLDALIVGVERDAAGLSPSHAAAPLQEGGSDDEMPPEALAPPKSPKDYDFASAFAIEAGLSIDAAHDDLLRESFHRAGVDRSLASMLYMAAIGAALRPQEGDAEHETSATALRERWGANFDANLKAANDEARAIFEFLPSAVTGGLNFGDYVRSIGLANNRPVIEQLLLRAKHRGLVVGV